MPPLLSAYTQHQVEGRKSGNQCAHRRRITGYSGVCTHTHPHTHSHNSGKHTYTRTHARSRTQQPYSFNAERQDIKGTARVCRDTYILCHTHTHTHTVGFSHSSIPFQVNTEFSSLFLHIRSFTANLHPNVFQPITSSRFLFTSRATLDY